MKYKQNFKLVKENWQDALKTWLFFTLAGTALFSLVFVAPIYLNADKLQGNELLLPTLLSICTMFFISGLLSLGTFVYILFKETL